MLDFLYPPFGGQRGCLCSPFSSFFLAMPNSLRLCVFNSTSCFQGKLNPGVQNNLFAIAASFLCAKISSFLC